MAIIRVDKVSKRYRFAKQRPFLLRELISRITMRPVEFEEHWALRDVAFSIERGESVGVVGINGSGKSTLLSLIARTSYPTEGEIEVHGRVGSLLELGAGFHTSLTGIENIFLNASLMGLSREQVEDRLEAIIEYADIGEYIEAEMSTYSTGMIARVGFAIMASLEPEILIVDEALSVGDLAFTQKCQATMGAMLARGTTMLLVSHDMETVRNVCQRVLWIHEGELRMDGPSEDVLHAYWKTCSEHGDPPAETTEPSAAELQ